MKKLILLTTILCACGLTEGDPDTEIPQSGESSSESTGALESDASSSEESTESDASSDESSSESSSTSTSSETTSTSSGDETTGAPPCTSARPRYDACGDTCSGQCAEGLVCRHADDLAECTQNCETDDECGAGTCSGGFCILFLCQTNDDCPGGMECYPGEGESDPEHPVAHCIPHAETMMPE